MDTETTRTHHRDHPALPHPPWRVPLLGDVFGFHADTPSQSAVDMARLGPIFEFTFLGARWVVAAAADVVRTSTTSRDSASTSGPTSRRCG